MNTSLLSLLLLLLLAGCGTFDPETFENRLVCTVAGDELHVISKYGPVGLASEIAEADRAVVCE